MSSQIVFISSTFKDLQRHRSAVWDALKHFDVLVRGMEEFGARATSPLETCLSEVEQSDVYIGIIAYRLGSIEPSSKKPYTSLEYEKAQEQKKEILIYLADDDAVAFPRSLIRRAQYARCLQTNIKGIAHCKHVLVARGFGCKALARLSQEVRGESGDGWGE